MLPTERRDWIKYFGALWWGNADSLNKCKYMHVSCLCSLIFILYGDGGNINAFKTVGVQKKKMYKLQKYINNDIICVCGSWDPAVALCAVNFTCSWDDLIHWRISQPPFPLLRPVSVSLTLHLSALCSSVYTHTRTQAKHTCTHTSSLSLTPSLFLFFSLERGESGGVEWSC